MENHRMLCEINVMVQEAKVTVFTTELFLAMFSDVALGMVMSFLWLF